MENVPELPDSPELDGTTIIALTALLERSRRASLLNALTLLIPLIQKKGYHFSDLLAAFADYTNCQVNEDRETSSTWKIVGSFLKTAFRDNITSVVDTRFLDSPLAEVGLSDLVDDPFSPFKRANLLKTVNNLTLVIFQQGYHFSELLLALADFAETKLDEADNKSNWRLMKLHLEAAAREAEARGRELP